MALANRRQSHGSAPAQRAALRQRPQRQAVATTLRYRRCDFAAVISLNLHGRDLGAHGRDQGVEAAIDGHIRGC